MASNDRMLEGRQPGLRGIGEPGAPDGNLRTGMRILCIAEDIQYARREIVPPLSDAGMEVDTVSADSPSVGVPPGEPYQLVVFDIGSRNGNGYSACARVRKLSNLPVMLVLHGAAREEILRGFHSGADAYILAPFDPREFLARLAGLLRRESPHPPCAV